MKLSGVKLINQRWESWQFRFGGLVSPQCASHRGTIVVFTHVCGRALAEHRQGTLEVHFTLRRNTMDWCCSAAVCSSNLISIFTSLEKIEKKLDVWTETHKKLIPLGVCLFNHRPESLIVDTVSLYLGINWTSTLQCDNYRASESCTSTGEEHTVRDVQSLRTWRILGDLLALSCFYCGLKTVPTHL